ncbi:MAG TPA: hypothetical protein VGH02_06890 [Rhizomicrobium sp.]|jgi:hypothetical protein
MRTTNVTKSALLMAAALTLALPGAALAHGGAGGHGGMGMGATMGGFGGNSASHISTNGAMNTNGPNATTRTFGTDRAATRHTATGASDTTSTSVTPNGGQSASHISASGLANTNGPNATDRETGKARANLRTQMNDSTNTTVPQQ